MQNAVSHFSAAKETREAAEPAGVAQKILAEQVDLLWRNSPLGYAVNIINATIVSAVLWRAFRLQIALWLTAVLGLVLLRALLYRIYLRARPPAAANVPIWCARFVAASAGSGLVWGALSLFFVWRAEPLHQLVIIFCVSGMVAGAITSNSFVRSAYYAFAVPAILPLPIYLFHQSGPVLLSMAMLLAVFTAAMFVAAYRFHRAFSTNLRNKYKVEVLANELAGAKIKLELNNRELDRLLAENRVMVQTASTGIVFVKNGAIAHCNHRFEELLGYAPGELLGQTVTEALLASERQPELAQRTMSAGGVYQEDLLVTRKNGPPLWCHRAGRFYDPKDPAQGTIWDYANIHERKRLEEMAKHHARHDALTELPNRTLMLDRLEQGMNRARRSQKRFAVLFVDLDHFKQLNDTLGHAAGDQLLQSIARRLQDCVRQEDTVCRHGGDEFVILLSEISLSADAENVALKILATIAHPIKLEEREVVLSASIGIALFPDDGDEAAVLIKRADLAMYQAKELGRNGYRCSASLENAPSPLSGGEGRGEGARYYSPS
jgi:diguanylate cyclase (GGDEF)-like protein/PAS domain S-box-containing protein